MGSDRPYFFAFNPKDFQNDAKVRLMTNAQKGLYVNLLCYAWDASPGGTIPADRDLLYRLSGCLSREEFERDIDGVLVCFRKHGPERLEQKRLKYEFDRAMKLRKQAVLNGKKGRAQQLANLQDNQAPPGREPAGSAGQRASESNSTTLFTTEGTVEATPALEGGEGGKPKGAKARAAAAEEIEAYCVERGLPAGQGLILWDKWQGNGWKNDKNPIRDWKATVRQWQGQGILPYGKGGANRFDPMAETNERVKRLKKEAGTT